MTSAKKKKTHSELKKTPLCNLGISTLITCLKIKYSVSDLKKIIINNLKSL